MMRGHPVPVSVCDLIVYPGKRTSRCPGHESPGLPAEPEPLVFALMGSSRLGPGHYRQVRQSEPWRYLSIRIIQPGRSPHQGARQPGQARPSVQAKPRQVRNIDGLPRPGLQAPAEGQKRPVDVEEEQRAPPTIGHGRTIALGRQNGSRALPPIKRTGTAAK